jgi:hypothetical protein
MEIIVFDKWLMWWPHFSGWTPRFCGGDDHRIVPDLVEIGLDAEENIVRGGGESQGVRW